MFEGKSEKGRETRKYIENRERRRVKEWTRER